jgi:hypothetical protein
MNKIPEVQNHAQWRKLFAQRAILRGPVGVQDSRAGRGAPAPKERPLLLLSFTWLGGVWEPQG